MADNYRNSSYKKKQAAGTPEQDFLESLFKGIWQLLKFLFGKKGGKSGKSNNAAEIAKIRDHWQDVEMHVLQDATCAQAISEADKLLDAALQLKGVKGTTMGERLKASTGLFPHDLYQDIWQAHKIRNNLAHEVGARVTQAEAQYAVSTFRNALYKLGILS